MSTAIPFKPASQHVATILLVAGDGDHAGLIRAIEHEGYRVERRAPREDVAAAAAETRAALVLLHLGGDSDALAWCARLKQDQRFHLLPVIVLTMHNGWDDRVAALQAGADSVFAHSLETNRLLHRIDELIGGTLESEPSLILLVDSDDALRNASTDALQSAGFRVAACRDPQAIFPSLDHAVPDAIVLGERCGGLSGLDLYEALKRQDGLHHVPTILVAEFPTSEERLVALRLGIDDYVAPGNPRELATRIATRVGQTRFFKRAASRDALTGVLNYRAFMDRLNHEIERASRYDLPFTLVLLDMDGFKQLNDRFGHLAGNRALQELVLFIRRQVRKSDLIARLGGDEFAVLMIEAPKDAIAPKWEGLRRAFGATALPLGENGGQAHIGFSFGMASWPQDGTALERLIASADHELYRRKGEARAA